VTPYFETSDVTIYQADSRTAWRDLPEHSADAIVTSPPYWGLRDYGHDGQIGLEDDPSTYIGELADLLTGYGERVLKPGGSLWLNLGDSYSTGNGAYNIGDKAQIEGAHAHARPKRGTVEGMPAKCLMMIPERVALALIERGWILRNRVVWAKPNGMPSSVQDRLATKHEALFHLVRQQRYYYDLDAIREPNRLQARPQSEWSAQDWQAHRNLTSGRINTQDSYQAAMNGDRTRKGNRANPSADGPGDSTFAYNPNGKNPGDVWTIPTQPYPDAHFAVFPRELVRRPILATVPEQVCRACGAGRERVVKVEREGTSLVNAEGSQDDQRIPNGWKQDPTRRLGANIMDTRETTGWSDCGCDAGFTAGTVLDPFFGSGTTAVMARSLGRKTVGVELSEDYCALAAKRFTQNVLDFGGDAA